MFDSTLLALLLGGTLVGVSLANAANMPAEFAKAEVIEVKSVRAVPNKSFTDNKWQQAPLQTIRLYPQQVVHLNDAVVNGHLPQTKPIEMKVRALYSSKEIALWLEWRDETKNLFSEKETTSFADSVAIEVPKVFGEGHRLPYVGMGDEKYPVILYIVQALAKSGRVKVLSAQGFGSSAPLAKASVDFKMEYDSTQRVWRVIWRRAMAQADSSLAAHGLIPMAFAVWDGEGRERGGNKSLSSWKFLHLERSKFSEKYLAEMSFGYHPGDIGDPA